MEMLMFVIWGSYPVKPAVSMLKQMLFSDETSNWRLAMKTKNLFITLLSVITIMSFVGCKSDDGSVATSGATSGTSDSSSTSSSVTATGDVGGTTKDAVTGTVEGSVTVNLRNQSGGIVATTTSDVNGVYSFTDILVGSYTLEFTKAGYISGTETITVVDSQVITVNPTISETLASGQIRIVLTWGTLGDLDSHVFYTGSPANFHVYYKTTSSNNVTLDVDDTDGEGPETMTISSQLAGTYEFHVYDYNGLDILQNRSAHVKVYDDTGLIGNFSVPAATGTLWKVFSLTGGVVTPINTMIIKSGFTPTDYTS